MVETCLITTWEEHRFWLEILEDHAYFVRDHLSPAEFHFVNTANQYIQAFSLLRSKQAQIDRTAFFSSPELIEFSKEAQKLAFGYFQFEGLLQNLRSQNKVNLNLTPTYLNGTLLENQEYLRILSYYVNGQDFPNLSLVDLLDLWVTDQQGHAVLFRNVVDPSEFIMLRKIETFINKFQGFLAQNKQMRLLLRFLPLYSPRQQRLSRDIAETTINMYKFIQEAETLFLNQELFTRTTLRFLEHHFPETCYFLKKLSSYLPELSCRVAYCALTKPSFN